MKKFFPAFMAFLLVFSTIGPLPGVAEGFPGRVTYDVVAGDDNKGVIKVDMDGGNSAWKITLHKKSTGNRVGDLLNENTSFPDVTPGIYEVRAEKIDSNPKLTEVSPAITVKPKPILAERDVTTEPYRIIISNVIPGSEVNLYKPDSQVPYKTQKPNANNIVIFNKIDANKSYSVTHFIDGANSIHSSAITVNPAPVTLEWVKDSGAANNSGEIKVTGTKVKNNLIIYRAENVGGISAEYKQITAVGPTTTVSGLRDGVYSIIQSETEDHLKSEISNEVVIKNEQKPTIELEKPIYEIFHNVQGQNEYTNPGYKITNKNGTTSEIRYDSLVCAPANNLKVSVSIEYEGGVIGNGQKPNPGKYKAIYTATDCENQQLYNTAIREVIVYPEKIKVNKTVNTLEYHGSSPIERHQFGSITVENVFNNADLFLYQDPSESNDLSKAQKIREITNLNENTYTFPDVPVGKGYFVFQEVEGVKSKFSDRVEIKDTTPPKIILNAKDGAINIDLEVGDEFKDPGFTAVDNIEIAEKIVTYHPSPVNTSQPGEYTIFYNAKDTGGLSAIQQVRTVTVRPKPVMAIGSTAAVGEIGVTNIFPSTQTNKTILKLYKANNDGVFPDNIDDPLKKVELDAGQTTYVFKNIEPGRYLVRQEVKSQISRQSNVVEVVDIDKPHITLIGPENINLTLDSELEPYYTKNKQFKDPGITAEDYLSNEQNPLSLTSTLVFKDTDVNSYNVKGTSIKYPEFNTNEPGIYKIRYTAVATRGAKALPKYRTITVAPPKPGLVTATSSTIKVSPETESGNQGIYSHSTTRANLYNAYGQLIKSKNVTNSNNFTFEDVPAGFGYYVTQTVNGIESQPSLPVNVSIFGDAKPNALITSFNFKEVDAISVIDQKAEKITVTVPKTAKLTSLTPVITSIGTVTPNPSVITDFSDGQPKLYRVVNSANNTTTEKTYSVTVKHAANSSTGSLPLEKDGELTPLSPSVSLSPAEVETAKDHGVTFITKDKKAEAHVPASNVIESRHSTFTLKQPLANGPYEISFGNLSRFMQPIELKLPKSGTKTLAKLVDGYTVAVPSAAAATATTSLINEPGTYALVDNVGAPRINPPATGSASYTLQLALLETSGTIYYTTSSKDISFTSSALSNDKPLKDRYIATASPADILKWTKYTPDEKISAPSGELYAVVVKGNQISQIASLEAAPAIDWSKNIPSYDTHKVLSINFNARVDREALYSGLIYVTDDTTNEKVAAALQMSSDGKTIYVVPQKAYTRGKQYTLHIDRQFKGNTKNKEFLKKSLLQTFTIN
ncbi:immunoglobulin-like domain-containing protein [Sporosarcina sp. P33]|uniref:immunoglobulin-like domain-containing protein n=1 Tax=Sporosarcina sp. P33 TaxID=1930764 RepID=UPI0009C387BC|nr:immunoglobulin-like domain-containing protein [Sporosarcina sp. P33]ARD48912.1 hypothetical protein SporoP33_12190 [Sporosarcina sp. P33]